MIVPPGRFIIGTVILKSNVNIYLEPGALLEGSKNLDDYIATFRKHGMFFSEDAENLSITGKGTIDAQGTHFPLLNQTFAIYAKSGKIIQFTKYRMIFHTLQQVLVERKITNSAKANSYLNREYRSGWRLDEI